MNGILSRISGGRDPVEEMSRELTEEIAAATADPGGPSAEAMTEERKKLAEAMDRAAAPLPTSVQPDYVVKILGDVRSRSNQHIEAIQRNEKEADAAYASFKEAVATALEEQRRVIAMAEAAIDASTPKPKRSGKGKARSKPKADATVGQAADVPPTTKRLVPRNVEETADARAGS